MSAVKIVGRVSRLLRRDHYCMKVPQKKYCAKVEGRQTTGEGKCAVVCLELEAYPEPKVLMPTKELRELSSKYGVNQAACRIGASEAFVRQNMLKHLK